MKIVNDNSVTTVIVGIMHTDRLFIKHHAEE